MKTPIIGGIIVLVLTFFLGFGLVVNSFNFDNGSVNFESSLLTVLALGLSTFAGIFLIGIGQRIKNT